jgi:hypothetical protein
LADPGPLTVSAASPQQPNALFVAPEGWFWDAGEYIVSIIAQRATSDTPLTGQVGIQITAADLERLQAGGSGLFLEFRVTPVDEQ